MNRLDCLKDLNIQILQTVELGTLSDLWIHSLKWPYAPQRKEPYSKNCTRG